MYSCCIKPTCCFVFLIHVNNLALTEVPDFSPLLHHLILMLRNISHADLNNLSFSHTIHLTPIQYFLGFDKTITSVHIV